MQSNMCGKSNVGGHDCLFVASVLQLFVVTGSHSCKRICVDLKLKVEKAGGHICLLHLFCNCFYVHTGSVRTGTDMFI